MEEFNVKNILFSSSACVYGIPKYLPIDEKHPCSEDAITHPYGKSKLVCEQILKDASTAHPVSFEWHAPAVMQINGDLSFLLVLHPSRIGIL